MKKIIVSIIVIGLLLSTVPLSTVGEEAVDEREEESNSIISAAIIDPSALSKDEAINILKMTIDDLSLEYSDDPEIQQVITMIEEQLLLFPENKEGVAESSSSLCILILFLIVLNVARVLGVKMEQVWAIINGFGSPELWIVDIIFMLGYSFKIVLLAIAYKALCIDNDGGGSTSNSTVAIISDVLNIEGLETLTIPVDCGCMQGSPTNS